VTDLLTLNGCNKSEIANANKKRQILILLVQSDRPFLQCSVNDCKVSNPYVTTTTSTTNTMTTTTTTTTITTDRALFQSSVRFINGSVSNSNVASQRSLPWPCMLLLQNSFLFHQWLDTTLHPNTSTLQYADSFYISQGSVATSIMCGGNFNDHFAANCPRCLPVNEFNHRQYSLCLPVDGWPGWVELT